MFNELSILVTSLSKAEVIAIGGVVINAVHAIFAGLAFFFSIFIYYRSKKYTKDKLGNDTEVSARYGSSAIGNNANNNTVNINNSSNK